MDFGHFFHVADNTHAIFSMSPTIHYHIGDDLGKYFVFCFFRCYKLIFCLFFKLF